MKKIIIFFLCMAFTLPVLAAPGVHLYDLSENDLYLLMEDKDWVTLMDQYFLPSLINSDYLYPFAAELNISNGERNKVGERYMFGKLVSIESVYGANHMPDRIVSEVPRLLTGPWLPKGGTTFSLAKPNYAPARYLAVDGWHKNNLPYYAGFYVTIRHTTDTYGSVRYAHLLFWIDEGEVYSVLVR